MADTDPEAVLRAARQMAAASAKVTEAFTEITATLRRMAPALQNLAAVVDAAVAPTTVDLLLWDMELTGEYQPY